MSADIYVLMRGILGDADTPYTVPDFRLLKYLDAGIDALSSMTTYTINEDVVISSADIAAGYKDLTHEVVAIDDFNLIGDGVYWELAEGKRIRFIQTDAFTPNTYEIQYRARYKRFDGAVRDNSYFDYPRKADLAIVFYALGLYASENYIVKTDGTMGAVQSKSEEGMSISYGGGTEAVDLRNPSSLMERGIGMMRDLNNGNNMWMSVMI